MSLTGHFPRYTRIRALLPLLDQGSLEVYGRLRETLRKYRGTPQAPADWSDPEAWIEERLEEREQKLARKIWRKSGVNPRYLTGSLQFCSRHDLLEESGGSYVVTERGRRFVAEPDGRVGREIDEAEGLVFVLGLVEGKAPARRSDLLPSWREFAQVHGIRGEKAVKGYLWARLRNLVDRGLLERGSAKYGKSSGYTVSAAGVEYLREAGGDVVAADPALDALEEAVGERQRQVRNQMREALSGMDPIAFEDLVRDLLEAMGYDEPVRTPASNDKGVDVIAGARLGISTVKVGVQVKRRQGTVQRATLDALRGSLPRFGAVQGMLITTSRFSKGAREEVSRPGQAPIELIDGEMLVDLMIEHEIGVKRRPVELWTLDREVFTVEGDPDSDDG